MPRPSAKRTRDKASTELSPSADGLWVKMCQKFAELEFRITTKTSVTLDAINSDMSAL